MKSLSFLSVGIKAEFSTEGVVEMSTVSSVGGGGGPSCTVEGFERLVLLGTQPPPFPIWVLDLPGNLGYGAGLQLVVQVIWWGRRRGLEWMSGGM